MAFAAVAVVAFASPAEAQVSSTTTVSASPSTVPIGRSVALNAAVTCAGDPSGGLGMTFFDGANLLATVPVAANGTASLTTGFTTAGAHTITAAYNGDANCDASSGTTTVEVTADPTPPYDSHNTYNNIHNVHITRIHNDIRITRIHIIHNIHNVHIHDIVKGGGHHRSWKSWSHRHQKSH